MKTNSLILVLPVVSLCLLGCQGPRIYHSEQSVFPSPETNFYSAFIEIDEHGELWAPTQISNAVKLVKSSEPVFLVTYIHGWKNNADLKNDNYRGFTNMLDGLARQLGDEKSDAKLTVVGVYIGWRGDSVRWNDPLSRAARQLTFWGRRNAAERVAGTSATESLYSILQAANSQSGSKVVLIGHSMGGLILEKALSQAFVSSLLAQSKNNGPVTNKAPANLVLLVNSAAPSIYARQLISMLQRLPVSSGANGGSIAPNTFDEDNPLLVSITSKADWATGKIFPIGMRLGAWNKSFRRYATNDDFGGKQLDYYTSTAGHNPALWSHRIKLLTNQVVKGIVAPGQTTDQMQQQAAKDALRENMDIQMEPGTFTHEGKRYRIAQMDAPKRKNNTPYWVMRVPKSIIKDHGDIFNDGFTALIGALLRAPEATDPGVPRRQIDPRQFKAK